MRLGEVRIVKNGRELTLTRADIELLKRLKFNTAEEVTVYHPTLELRHILDIPPKWAKRIHSICSRALHPKIKWELRDEIRHQYATTLERVEYILEKFPITRNSDKALDFYYWAYVDGLPVFFPKSQLSLMTPAATIERARRVVQNDEGKFPPTLPGIRKARGIKEQEIRNFISRPREEWEEAGSSDQLNLRRSV